MTTISANAAQPIRSSKGTFELLWCWLNGETLYESPAETLSEQHRLALTNSVRRSKYGFALVVERNWRREKQTREVHLTVPSLRELWDLPEGAAVDRLLGYDDGNRWVPGIAGVTQMQQRCLRLRMLDLMAYWAIAKQEGITAATAANHVSSALARLREFFSLPPARTRRPVEEGNPLTCDIVAAGELSPEPAP